MKDVIVIGGGPSGMMAAISAAMNGATVALIEKNKKTGSKLLLTGKGRCNVTNFCDEQTLLSNVVRNSKFLYSAFYRFNSADTMNFFENLGVPLKVERGGRVFPVSDRAADIRNVLDKCLSDYGVEVICDEVISLNVGNDVNIQGKKRDYSAKCCVIATGGLSYSETGCTGDGYIFAQKIGHKIITPEPSLVGLRCKEFLCRELSGLTLKNVEVSFFQQQQRVYSDFGELLFTHIGVSGPTVLSASAHFTSFKNAKLMINLKPALSCEQLDKRLLRDFNENANKNVINALEGLLPKRLLPVVLERAGIYENQKVHQITKEQRGALLHQLRNFELTLIGKEGIERAIITSGGIAVDEVSPKTMCSKLCDKIFFAGEVLDVDAYTGGFNLQIAFSTGYLAGMSAAEVAL